MISQSFKMDCEVCYDGTEALEQIRYKFNQKCCQKYSLIFMDIDMPVKIYIISLLNYNYFIIRK